MVWGCQETTRLQSFPLLTDEIFPPIFKIWPRAAARWFPEEVRGDPLPDRHPDFAAVSAMTPGQGIEANSPPGVTRTYGT
jgi:hypothetical protein